MIFCDTLKFDNHKSNCVNKANITLCIVKRSFSYLDTEMSMQLYKTLIRPHLEYSTVVWNPYLKKNIFVIENAHSQVIKLVHGLR